MKASLVRWIPATAFRFALARFRGGCQRFRSAMHRWRDSSRRNQRLYLAAKWVVFGGFSGFFAFVAVLAGAFLYLNPQLPELETYSNFVHERPLRVFASDGALLAEYGTRRLIPIELEEVPELYVKGLIATEDHRFYSHNGIDWWSLANDMLALLTNPDIRRGASTITMQLPRNIGDLSRERTFIRKFKEMLLALKIERELTKDEILELYINVVPFGKQSYGVQAAAFTYYGKPASELSLAQLAMLAGISKRPEAANPINGPEPALARRNLVLRRMVAQGIIDRIAFEDAVAQPITARVHRRELDLYSPYPCELVRQELVRRFGRQVYSGFNAYTTIVTPQQAAAQNAVRSVLLSYDRRYGWRRQQEQVELDPGTEIRPQLVSALAGRVPLAGLLPVAVLDVQERSITVVGRQDRETAIEWEGIKWAREFRGTDVYSPPPKTADQVVSTGDIVWIREAEEGEWHLAQVPEVQGALVAVDPSHGGITAMVGGFDFGIRQFNHATQARRQPGSGFKPFVYSSALSVGRSPASIYLDAPLRFDNADSAQSYRPRNDSMRYNGPTRLREALYRSINLVSMRVVEDIGYRTVQDHASLFGFEREALPNDAQLAIGGGTMSATPLQMASAYAVFANGGFRVEPHLISYVEDHLGNVVHEPIHPRACDPCTDDATVLEESIQLAELEPDQTFRGATLERSGNVKFVPADRVFDAKHAFLIDSMLRDVVKRGTGSRARQLGRTDLAGKTGTTNEAADTWFNGYHRSVAATAWVGFSTRRSLGENEWGSTRPLSIWIEFMETALEGVEELAVLPPDGIAQVRIDPETGELADPGQPGSILEYLREEDLPKTSKVGERESGLEFEIEELF